MQCLSIFELTKMSMIAITNMNENIFHSVYSILFKAAIKCFVTNTLECRHAALTPEPSMATQIPLMY